MKVHVFESGHVTRVLHTAERKSIIVNKKVNRVVNKYRGDVNILYFTLTNK